MRCRDGSIKDVIISSSVLWENGEFIHTRCFTLDVSDRRLAEAAHGLLAAVVESSQDAIVTKTLDGIITSWNAGAERLFGYTAAEAVGRSITLIIPPERLDEETQILAKLRRGERVEHFDTVRLSKHGQFLDISLTISPIRNAAGRVIGVSKVARDVTDRKRTEIALRATEDALRQADRRKDEFLATLAHELRNPLAPVRNALEIMKQAAGDPALVERARAHDGPADVSLGAAGRRPAGHFPHHAGYAGAAHAAGGAGVGDPSGASRPAAPWRRASITRCRWRCRGARLPERGPDPPGAGLQQPVEQRLQVHGARRTDPADGPSGRTAKSS